MKECPALFSQITQPPQKIKTSWKRMIPVWAWNAMVDDTTKILEKALPEETKSEDIERSIKNRFVFIKREAFFPESFLPDVVDAACKKIKKK